MILLVKGKEKFVQTKKEGPGPMPTRSSQRKLLSDAMQANKSRTMENRRKRKRVVNEDQVSETNVVDVSLEKE